MIERCAEHQDEAYFESMGSQFSPEDQAYIASKQAPDLPMEPMGL